MYIRDIHSCPLTIISSVLWLTYFTKSYYISAPLPISCSSDISYLNNFRFFNPNYTLSSSLAIKLLFLSAVDDVVTILFMYSTSYFIAI